MKNFQSTSNAIALRMSGLKATPRRIAVLILFTHLKEPISAPYIAKILAEIGFEIHLAGIYRILAAFDKKRLIIKVGYKVHSNNDGRNKEIMYVLKR